MANQCVGDCVVPTGKWYGRIDDDDENTYCEYCIENGCVSIVEDKLIEVTEDYDGGYSCDCPKRHEHPRMKLDCCPGSTSIDCGTWYTPPGKSVEECTYCEWCVENKCIESDNLTRVMHFLVDCTCDCPKCQDKFISPLTCPACENNVVMGTVFEGDCKNCGTDADFTYCRGCSYLLKSCWLCGETIKSGDEYVEKICNTINEQIIVLSQKFEAVIEKYGGRTKDEVICELLKKDTESN